MRVLRMGLVAAALVIFASAQFHLPGLGGSGNGGNAGKSPKPASTTTATPRAAASNPAYDYFVLALSWAPNFCANSNNAAQNPQECGVGKKVAFVVHGLWPEVNAGQSPENCGKATTVKKAIVNSILPYIPSASLVQHEWATHGTCSGLTQTAFFSDVMTARSSVQIPVQLTALEDETTESPGQIESQFAEANTGFPEGAFRTDCVSGQLAEMRICFDKNLKVQICTASVAECSTAEIGILPPR